MQVNTKEYIERFLKIKSKDAEIISFKINKPQMKLYELLKKQYREGKPQRVIILKARQMGFSTLTEAILFKRTATRQNTNSGIITHKSDATTNLFNMSKLFLQELPEQLKPRTKASNANEIIFDTKTGGGLRSKIKCMTAGGDGVGRSDTFQNLHLSEVAMWPHTKEIMDGLLQTVPNRPDTLVIIESTANGYDYFKELWDKAVNGENDFTPLFCAWHELDEYRMPAPSDMELTGDERVLKERFGLDNDQLAWRRWCIRNNCGGDINTFKQEYPSFPEEAFLMSGNCVFDKEKINDRIAALRVKPKEKKGYFTYKKELVPIYVNGEIADYDCKIGNIEFTESENGYITLHEEPRVKKDSRGEITHRAPYALGGDTAGTGIDYFSAKVVCTIDQKAAATLHKQSIDEDLYAEQCYCLGMYYNTAQIAIEINYSRQPTRLLAQKYHYPNLYMREKIDAISDRAVMDYGFETNSRTRPIIISELVTLFREFSDIEADIATLSEMLSFVKKENGRIEAADGAHDDLVMASAIAHFTSKNQIGTWERVETADDKFIEENFNLDTQGGNESFMSWEEY